MDETTLISQLRSEAQEVKDCFTKFSFQSLAITTAAIGIIIKFQQQVEIISLGCFPIIILLLSVAKIGNHKYNTANRNYGYILYLERMRSLRTHKESNKKLCESYYHWEEAMRAWRIVQTTVFSTVYHTGSIMPNKKIIKCKTCENSNCMNVYKISDKNNTHWFEPGLIAKTIGADYHAGSYLQAVHKILFFISILSSMPIAYSAWQYSAWKSRSGNLLFSWLFLSIFFCAAVIIFWRYSRITQKRKILEGGLLSIHSNGTLWEAVMVAHKNALLKSFISYNYDEVENTHPNEPYTKILCETAVDLSKNICNIRNWIEKENIETHNLSHKIKMSTKKNTGNKLSS